jgi:hypothetical protein
MTIRGPLHLHHVACRARKPHTFCHRFDVSNFLPLRPAQHVQSTYVLENLKQCGREFAICSSHLLAIFSSGVCHNRGDALPVLSSTTVFQKDTACRDIYWCGSLSPSPVQFRDATFWRPSTPSVVHGWLAASRIHCPPPFP